MRRDDRLPRSSRPGWQAERPRRGVLFGHHARRGRGQRLSMVAHRGPGPPGPAQRGKGRRPAASAAWPAPPGEIAVVVGEPRSRRVAVGVEATFSRAVLEVAHPAGVTRVRAVSGRAYPVEAGLVPSRVSVPSWTDLGVAGVDHQEAGGPHTRSAQPGHQAAGDPTPPTARRTRPRGERREHQADPAAPKAGDPERALLHDTLPSIKVISLRYRTGARERQPAGRDPPADRVQQR